MGFRNYRYFLSCLFFMWSGLLYATLMNAEVFIVILKEGVTMHSVLLMLIPWIMLVSGMSVFVCVPYTGIFFPRQGKQAANTVAFLGFIFLIKKLIDLVLVYNQIFYMSRLLSLLCKRDEAFLDEDQLVSQVSLISRLSIGINKRVWGCIAKPSIIFNLYIKEKDTRQKKIKKSNEGRLLPPSRTDVR